MGTRRKDAKLSVATAIMEARRRTRLWRVILVLAVVVLLIQVVSGLIGQMRPSKPTTQRTGSSASVSTPVSYPYLMGWLAPSTQDGQSPLGPVTSVVYNGSLTVGTNQYVDKYVVVTTTTDGQTESVGSYTVSLDVGLVDNTWSVIGSPTVLPSGDPSRSTPELPKTWKPIADTHTTPNQREIAQWSEAFIGSDGDALTTVVQDPEASHYYKPLSLGEYTSASISSIKVRPDGYAVADVSIQYSDVGEHPQSHTVEYYVLVANPDTSAPKVVAWGPVGDAGLAPYSNWVAGSGSDAS